MDVFPGEGNLVIILLFRFVVQLLLSPWIKTSVGEGFSFLFHSLPVSKSYLSLLPPFFTDIRTLILGLLEWNSLGLYRGEELTRLQNKGINLFLRNMAMHPHVTRYNITRYMLPGTATCYQTCTHVCTYTHAHTHKLRSLAIHDASELQYQNGMLVASYLLNWADSGFSGFVVYRHTRLLRKIE